MNKGGSSCLFFVGETGTNWDIGFSINSSPTSSSSFLSFCAYFSFFPPHLRLSRMRTEVGAFAPFSPPDIYADLDDGPPTDPTVSAGSPTSVGTS